MTFGPSKKVGRLGRNETPPQLPGSPVRSPDHVRLEEHEQRVPAFTMIPDFVPTDSLSALREEAHRLRASASRRERQGFRLTHEGRLLCALRNWFVGRDSASVLDPPDGLSSQLGGLLHMRLRLTHSSYLYYERGDFLGLHRDHRSCRITLLLWLAGPAGPLHVHPELHELNEEDLLRTALTWDGHPPGGELVDLGQGPVLVPGHSVPHHRPPHPYAEELVLATFCFALA